MKGRRDQLHIELCLKYNMTSHAIRKLKCIFRCKLLNKNIVGLVNAINVYTHLFFKQR